MAGKDNYKKIKILIASPSDVQKEREIAKQVIQDWNDVNSDDRKMVFDAVLWEDKAAPESGDRTQGIINRQIVNKCECAIGMFLSRIGTDTGIAPGGAVEEIEHLEKKGKLIMLYFSKDRHPNDANLKQIEKVREFKASRQNKGLTWDYENPNDFKDKLTKHLGIQLLARFCGEKEDKIHSDGDQVLSSLEDAYQSTLKEELGWIKLLGSPDIERVQVGLTDTFVPLRISDRWKSEEQFNPDYKVKDELEEDLTSPDEILQWVFSHYRMFLVIGDPGSGKTTLLKYYAICCLEHKHEKLFQDDGSVRVFFFPLRELKQNDAGFLSLPENLSLWAAERGHTIEPGIFNGWLRDRNKKSLVLLDGLDEISDLEKRKAACAWIDNTWSGFSSVYFVVTGRSTVVHGPDKVEFAATYSRADVKDFSHKQQKSYLLKWFTTVYTAERPPRKMPFKAWLLQQESFAEKKATAIYDYLYPVEQHVLDKSQALSEKRERKGLQELAAVPMMLQIMAILFKEKEFLPGNRAKLYSATLNYLLEIRDTGRKILPPLPCDKARRVLAPVALWMQEELHKDEAARSKVYAKMKSKLEEVCSPGQPPTTEEFCHYLVNRAGLLVEYGGQDFIFRHKTFREYLAGEQLSQEKHKEHRIKEIVSHFGDDWWNEPLIFFMAQIDAETFDFFMREVFASSASEKLLEKQTLLRTLIEESAEKKTDALCEKLLDPKTSQSIQLSVLDCLQTIGMGSALESLRDFRSMIVSGKVNNEKNKKILDRTEEIIFNIEKAVGFNTASATRKVHLEAIGIEAGRPGTGSPTLTVNPSLTFRNPYEHDAQYILIHGGEYLYSETKREVTVSDLYVAKYPVTNKQYRSFIDFLAGKPSGNDAILSLKSYKEALHDLAESKDDAVKGFKEYLKDEQSLAERFRSEYDDDRKFNKDDQPVVGVGWYAARAYCLWLTMLADDGIEYRLPNEKEWEWAAGGRRDRPDEVLGVRKYPWGDEPEPTAKHANYDENEGATTPVGRYPDGATPEGLYDMAGNVWEWMDVWYDDNTKRSKALRGGSWDLNAEDLACSSRVNFFPDLRLNFFGFRVVRPSLPREIEG